MPESTSEERRLIEQLMQEEAEVADDPTQNALLPSPSEPVLAPPTPDTDEDTQPQAQEGPQYDPGIDVALSDESDAIRLPDELAEPDREPGEDLVQGMEPEVAEALQQPPVDWDESGLELEVLPAPEEPDDPYARAMNDMDWAQTLQQREQSLI